MRKPCQHTCITKPNGQLTHAQQFCWQHLNCKRSVASNNGQPEINSDHFTLRARQVGFDEYDVDLNIKYYINVYNMTPDEYFNLHDEDEDWDFYIDKIGKLIEKKTEEITGIMGTYIKKMDNPVEDKNALIIYNKNKKGGIQYNPEGWKKFIFFGGDIRKV
jgi:hypothetical protein